MKNPKIKLIIIGPLPPPIGGVGVHIQRFIKHNLHKYEIRLVDYSRLTILYKLLALLRLAFQPGKFDFYVNHVNKLVFLSLLIRPFNKQIVFYDHNFRYIENTNWLEKKIFLSFIKSINKINVVNASVIGYYQDYGIDIKTKVEVVNPFLPPPLDEEMEIMAGYPEWIIKIFEDKRPLLIANAVRLEKYRNIDLYGIDMCIELTNLLKKDFDNIGFAFFIAEDESPDLKDMLRLIREYQLQDSFFFISGSQQLWPLLKKCDLFLRPTYSDGDAISIREALYFNKTVIASNAVERPEGIVLFKNRDIIDLYLKTRIALGLSDHQG